MKVIKILLRAITGAPLRILIAGQLYILFIKRKFIDADLSTTYFNRRAFYPTKII